MKNATIRLVVILGALAIAGILVVQAYWFTKTWSSSEEEFERTVTIGLLNVAKSMADYNGSILPSTGVIKRISSNYYVVNFNDVIDANILEYYLLEEFGSLGVNTNFEYAIYDCGNDEMVYGNFCNVEDPEFSGNSSTNLATYNDFIYYFGVHFPNHEMSILKEMDMTILFSVIAFLAVVFFSYAIVVILRQKHVSELQRDFINNMTHEFKTPISSIKVSSDVLIDSPEIANNDRLSQYASIIKQQNDRLNTHVEKVLSIARLDESQFSLNLEDVNLHDTIKEVVKSKELEMDKAEGRFELKLEALNPMVKADRLHLSNVLYNLVDNGIKYGGKNPIITIETIGSGANLELSIRDNGPGIAAEHQKQLFKKFYRIPTGNIHNVKGFGLGLHYVKRIVDKHDWSIKVNSAPGEGTEMRIII